MLALLTSLISYVQTNFPDFVGSYVYGNTEQLGPFLNVAPEPFGLQASEADYMTYQTFGTPSDLGFINSSGATTYTENPRIRFFVWSIDPDAAMGNMETFVNKMDKLQSLTLTGTELCKSILREQVPQNLPQPKSKNGGQVYCFYCDYLFRNVRTLGAA